MSGCHIHVRVTDLHLQTTGSESSVLFPASADIAVICNISAYYPIYDVEVSNPRA
jgi:hypothetical protein